MVSDVMPNHLYEFERRGCTVVKHALSISECRQIKNELPDLGTSGTRRMLDLPSIRDLAADLRNHRLLSPLLSKKSSVLCTLFKKTKDHNWSLKMHRDMVFPVGGEGSWPSAGVKEGLTCVHPPRAVLDQCVAVRLNLDDAPEGDILFEPGSHLHNKPADTATTIPAAAEAGDAIVLCPTTIHGSAKLRDSDSRFVLHFLFAPKELPHDYSWHYDA